ncbi:MAG: endonuclease MutS2 [Defluviitaleaceae bacterium]|nr:endonuclease MutS2 [Defluviitaleaceae bacterium]
MNKKMLKALEFEKITAMLTAKAAFSQGKLKCSELLPMTDIGDIIRAQNETSEAAGFILRKGSLPLGGISDIRAAIARAAAGGMLSAEDLLATGECLYVFKKLTTYGGGAPGALQTPGAYDGGDTYQPATNRLAQYFSAITTDEKLAAEIARCIKPSGEISDNASPKLAEVRRAIRTAHDRIRDKLQSAIHSAEYKNMLQDAIITMRGDRFCVPVKAEYRTNFPGMVHDQSSTGATVFMEPLSVVEQNNKIKDLRFDEKREEEKILFRLSSLVYENSEALDANLSIAAQLDFIFAKGELSLHMKATQPSFNSTGFINIRKGRHPLLTTLKTSGENFFEKKFSPEPPFKKLYPESEQSSDSNDGVEGTLSPRGGLGAEPPKTESSKNVIPVDVHLGGEFSMLLITGPNTGGKTVTLKTVGLFTLMGQAGLHIPALEGSELSVFEEVFADIGDEQSIEQSLSTFSSHMKNIVGILEKLGPNALVLLDELGAGTDPTEGAALAIALLSHLHERKIRTVVTTHYSELKLFALSTEGAENASCEFDVETLRPTYRLLIGIPGKSNAFAIAKRLGLPDAIIDDARAHLSQTDIRFEDVITDLEASKKLVQIEQERAAVYRAEAEKLRTDAARLEEKLRTQKEKILRDAREDALHIVRDAKRESEKIIADVRSRADDIKNLEDMRRTAREGLNALESSVAPIVAAPAHKPPENLRKGNRVHIRSMNQSGTVLSPPNASGEAQIQAGIMKITVHVSDLSLDEVAPEVKAEKFIKKRRNESSAKSLNISPEIDLRGMMPEEAVLHAERYLDDAFLASLSAVTIIHGKGTGVLRAAIQTMLKRQPNVKKFRPGKYGEGEDGVTIVEF